MRDTRRGGIGKILLIVFGGCAVLILALAVVGGILAYQMYKAVQPTIEKTRQIGEDYKQLDQDFPFTPPTDARLDPERFAAFVEVRRAVAATVQGKTDRIQSVGESVEKGKRAQFGDMMDVLKTGMSLFTDAMAVHVEELRARRMSSNEYKWMSKVMLATLFAAADKERPEAQAILDAYGDEETSTNILAVDSEDRAEVRSEVEQMGIPFDEENLALIVSHKDEITSPRASLMVDLVTLGLAGEAYRNK